MVLSRTRCLAVVAAAVLLVACEDDRGDGGPGEPCTRDRDCEVGLECSGGVCVGPDGGSEGP